MKTMMTAATTTTATIENEIKKVHIYKDDLSFHGSLYETAIKVISWIFDMNPADADEWVELQTRRHGSHADVQRWLDFNEANHDYDAEWRQMLTQLSEVYVSGGVQKLRKMERLEKALIIGSMVEAAIDPTKNGIF